MIVGSIVGAVIAVIAARAFRVVAVSWSVARRAARVVVRSSSSAVVAVARHAVSRVPVRQTGHGPSPAVVVVVEG